MSGKSIIRYFRFPLSSSSSSANILKHRHSILTSTANRNFHSKSLIMSDNSFPVTKSPQEWKAILSPEQFKILRLKGTERPGSGEYNDHKAAGIYNCAACEEPIYRSGAKFDSHCGWPAFYEAIPGSIRLNHDNSHGMTRTEMVCANCGGHLGHVFYGEGYKTPTDARHCVNSISLKFKPE